MPRYSVCLFSLTGFYQIFFYLNVCILLLPLAFGFLRINQRFYPLDKSVGAGGSSHVLFTLLEHFPVKMLQFHCSVEDLSISSYKCSCFVRRDV